jgi:maleate cis-trans isomerase
MTEGNFRVVLIIPAANTTMEPEVRAYFQALGPEIGKLRVARVPRTHRPLEPEDLPEYGRSTMAAVMPLLKGGVDLLIYGCTSAGFLAGAEGDAANVKKLSEASGAPVVSTASAILAVMDHMGIRNIDVVSPYPAWKNDTLRDFLSSAGVRINRMDSFDTKNLEEIGRITTEQVLEKALAIATPDAQAMFIACSQLPTAGIIPTLTETLKRPVWSSVKAAAWMASETLKASAKAPA